MKTLSIIQKLCKIGKILSKIAFILSVVAFCGCIAGLLSLNLGDGRLIKIGGVTLRGLVVNEHGYNVKSISAALCGWLAVCAGEGVLARFAFQYFKNELAAQTPFTLDGAREMLRLGVLALTLPLGCALAGRIIEGIVAGFMRVEREAALEICFDHAASAALGVMFIFSALLCRCGAELKAEGRA